MVHSGYEAVGLKMLNDLCCNSPLWVFLVIHNLWKRTQVAHWISTYSSPSGFNPNPLPLGYRCQPPTTLHRIMRYRESKNGWKIPLHPYTHLSSHITFPHAKVDHSHSRCNKYARKIVKRNATDQASHWYFNLSLDLETRCKTLRLQGWYSICTAEPCLHFPSSFVLFS